MDYIVPARCGLSANDELQQYGLAAEPNHTAFIHHQQTSEQGIFSDNR
ncbi:MAG: hypothetical protein ACRDGA_08205 [Bacteroidota bacterium]